MLQKHNKRLSRHTLEDLFISDPARSRSLRAAFGPLLFDYSRVLIDAPALAEGCRWIESVGLPGQVAGMMAGAPVNHSESRAALHTLLRDPEPSPAIEGADAVVNARRRMLEEARRLNAGDIEGAGGGRVTDFLAIGIGGSRLGPELVSAALPVTGGIRVHFLSNPDPQTLQRRCQSLDASTTAVCITSKSFTTRETRALGDSVLEWRKQVRGGVAPLYAVTANRGAALELGVEPKRLFPMWDFVGGRFSVWSCAGFPAAVSCGARAFEQLLAGAHAMDRHFRDTAPADNLPMLAGLIDVWQRSFRGHAGLALVPYSDRLERLPAWLQQLWMESNGKGVTVDGETADLPTAGILFGGVGADVQHSFFQALHQGTQVIPAELVGIVGNSPAYDLLLANLIAQAEALMRGAPNAELPQRRFSGNRPSTILLLDDLDPKSLGMLLALYEHRVFVQACLWGINPFDQFGVELGKSLAVRLERHWADSDTDALTDSERALLTHIHQVRGRSR